jgi:hypothetical protein
LFAHFVLVVQKLDERPEGAGARRFKAAREIAKPVNVCQAPLSAGMEGKTDVGAEHIRPHRLSQKVSGL